MHYKSGSRVVEVDKGGQGWSTGGARVEQGWCKGGARVDKGGQVWGRSGWVRLN